MCMFLGIVAVVGCMEVMKFADELSESSDIIDVRNQDRNRSLRGSPPKHREGG